MAKDDGKPIGPRGKTSSLGIVRNTTLTAVLRSVTERERFVSTIGGRRSPPLPLPSSLLLPPLAVAALSYACGARAPIGVRRRIG
ncbi:MAG: hypothetical protein QM766_26610 [Burkholderiaceae bacterium]